MLFYLFEYAIQILLPSSFFAGSETSQVTSAATFGPKGTLYVTNATISPDGFPRSASIVNSDFPGPTIQANKGDAFELNVVNHLSDATMLRSTSIHWHGILQHGTNWADGPVGVSQCPISPSRSFLYRFNSNEAGTFWYHSHYGTQYCDGVRGALIVYDQHDPHKALYDVDDGNDQYIADGHDFLTSIVEATVMTLADWYHYPSPSLGHFPGSYSTLINGKGRYLKGPPVDLSVVSVEYGKRYRFRIINISCDSAFKFSIDNHILTVIEADAESVVPVLGIDTLEIFPGQRYSVVLAANQPVGNYWIRSLPVLDPGDPLGTFEGGLNSAILRYKTAMNTDPTTTPTNKNLLLETQLHALIDPAAPGLPTIDGGDANIHLQIDYNEKLEVFTINGKTFKPPPVPVLLQILTGTPPDKLLPSGSVIKLPRNKSISLSMSPGNFDGPHPFHLHGHSFSVVRSAESEIVPGSGKYNYRDPVRRDTVSLGEDDSNSNVTIRFRTDNPGPWILHCHIDWHLERGMAIVFAEAPEDTPDVVHPPTEWHYLCPIFDNLPETLTMIQMVDVPKTTPALPTPCAQNSCK